MKTTVLLRCLFLFGYVASGSAAALDCGAFVLQPEPPKASKRMAVTWKFGGRELQLTRGARFLDYSHSSTLYRTTAEPAGKPGLWAVARLPSKSMDLRSIIQDQINRSNKKTEVTPSTIEAMTAFSNALAAWNDLDDSLAARQVVSQNFSRLGASDGLLKPMLDLMNLAAGSEREAFAVQLTPAVAAVSPCIAASLSLARGFPMRLDASQIGQEDFASRLAHRSFRLNRLEAGTNLSTMLYGKTAFAQDKNRQADAPNLSDLAKQITKSGAIFASGGSPEYQERRKKREKEAGWIEEYKKAGFSKEESCDQQCAPFSAELFEKLSGDGLATGGGYYGTYDSKIPTNLEQSGYCKTACEEVKTEEAKKNEGGRSLNGPSGPSPAAPSTTDSVPKQGATSAERSAGSSTRRPQAGERSEIPTPPPSRDPGSPLCDLDPRPKSCDPYRTPVEIAIQIENTCKIAKCMSDDPVTHKSSQTHAGIPPVSSTGADFARASSQTSAGVQTPPGLDRDWGRALKVEDFEILDPRSKQMLRRLIEQRGNGGLTAKELNAIKGQGNVRP